MESDIDLILFYHFFSGFSNDVTDVKRLKRRRNFAVDGFLCDNSLKKKF